MGRGTNPRPIRPIRPICPIGPIAKPRYGVSGSLFPKLIVPDTPKHEKKGIGYNALTDEYCDMVKAGIVDPVKVTRSALENAASIGSLILTTESLIAEKPEEKPAPAMPGGGMGDYGM